MTQPFYEFASSQNLEYFVRVSYNDKNRHVLVYHRRDQQLIDEWLMINLPYEEYIKVKQIVVSDEASLAYLRQLN
jgi:hypothetical protein